MVQRGAVLAVLLLGAAHCADCGQSQQDRCAATCTGCCTAAGRCEAGTTAFACGSGGQLCAACAAGATCTVGFCVGGAGGGSGGGATGGGGGATGGGGGGTGGGLATVPVIEPDRTRLDFGGEFGTGAWPGTTLTETLQLRNAGVPALILTQVSVAGPQAASFQLQLTPALDGGSLTLPSWERAFVAVRFRGQDAGVYAATLTVQSNASNSASLPIPLQATVVAP